MGPSRGGGVTRAWLEFNFRLERQWTPFDTSEYHRVVGACGFIP